MNFNMMIYIATTLREIKFKRQNALNNIDLIDSFLQLILIIEKETKSDFFVVIWVIQGLTMEIE